MAQYILGCCYYNGHAVAQNREQAFRQFELSAKQGNAAAQAQLGQCYYEGSGVEKDLWKAVEWLREAAAQGIEEASVLLETVEAELENLPTPTPIPTPTPTPAPSVTTSPDPDQILTPAPSPTPLPKPTVDVNRVMVIPDSVKVIESEAFMGTSVQAVFIPSTVRKIDTKAFAQCNDLLFIHFENGDISVADDFISGSNYDIEIEAPEGSIVANSIPNYRSYLCAPRPDVDLNNYVVLRSDEAGESYIPVFSDSELTQLRGFIKAGTEMVVLTANYGINQILWASGRVPYPAAFKIRFMYSDEILYVSTQYI